MLPLDSLVVWYQLEKMVEDSVFELDEEAGSGSEMVVKEYCLLVAVQLFLVHLLVAV